MVTMVRLLLSDHSLSLRDRLHRVLIDLERGPFFHSRRILMTSSHIDESRRDAKPLLLCLQPLTALSCDFGHGFLAERRYRPLLVLVIIWNFVNLSASFL